MRDPLRRHRAVLRGRHAEFLAVWLLRLKGYRVLVRQYRVPAGEIDIIARRGAMLAVIEVKARADWVSAAESVRARQRRRIARAAEAFLQSRPSLAGCTMRFDVVLVAARHFPRHLAGAWRIDD